MNYLSLVQCTEPTNYDRYRLELCERMVQVLSFKQVLLKSSICDRVNSRLVLQLTLDGYTDCIHLRTSDAYSRLQQLVLYSVEGDFSELHTS